MVGGHATVGRLSNNVFWTFQAFWENFEKKSLNGHATVVEVTRLSADCQTTIFSTFQAIRNFFEKSRWTVTRQWSEVTRPSADCQTTFFWTFQAIWENFEKSRWTVTRQWSEVTRPSADCQTTFLDVSSDLGKFWKKSLNGHASVVEVTRQSADCQTTFFWTFQAIRKIFEKSRWTVTRQWSEVTRPSADCQTTFLDVLSFLGKFWKKSLNGHAIVVGGHATVGRLSKNVFWTFQAIWENFEKSRWTVTRQWSEVTRPSADCQTTFIRRFKQFGKILKKVAKKFTRQFSRLLTPATSLSVFHGNLPQQIRTCYYVAYVYNGEFVPLMGNQRVEIFPPKSKILFVLFLALIWCRNFQDRTIPVGGDTWTSFWRKDRRRRRIIIRIKKYPRSGLFFQSNISETVGDIRVLFPLWARAIVALPNGANDVSVVHIVSEIWRRQHQNFGMLTYTSERNQYPFEWIRTANNGSQSACVFSRIKCY